MEKSILVVDCQYDFINGSLACEHGEEAVDNIIKFINNNKNYYVCYSCDWHIVANRSFKENGGIWPVHCVQNTQGANLHRKFYEDIENNEQLPSGESNIFYKGIDNDIEEYSAVNAKNIERKSIKEKINGNVIVCGIASEYCVKETVKELLKEGFKVALYEDGVAYVNENEHKKTLEELKSLGVEII